MLGHLLGSFVKASAMGGLYPRGGIEVAVGFLNELAMEGYCRRLIS